MAFDFWMFNKPCVFINYDQQNKKEEDWSVKTIYEFQHFKSMTNQKAVIWLNSKEEISKTIVLEINQNAAMEQWKEKVLGDYKNASNKIRQKLIAV